MKLPRRVVVNLLAFALLSALLIGVGGRGLLGFDEPPTIPVEVAFDSTPGLRPGFDVTYLGYSVGTVEAVELGDDRVEVTLAVRAQEALPATLEAAIRRRSAVGEPYVDLRPVAGSDLDTRLAAGAAIPLERTSVPLAYGQLFDAFGAFLRAVPEETLASLVSELADGLDGRADDLRRAITGLGSITTTLAAEEQLLGESLRDLTGLTTLLADASGDLRSGLRSTSVLADGLEDARPAFEDALDRGGFLTSLDEVVRGVQPGLECTTLALTSVTDVLDQPTIDQLLAAMADAGSMAQVLDAVLVEREDTENSWIRVLLQLDNTSQVPVFDGEPEPVVVAEPGQCVAAAAGPTSVVGDAGSAGPPSARGGEPADEDGPVDPGAVAADPADGPTPVDDLDRVVDTVAPIAIALLAMAVGLLLVSLLRRRS